MNQAEIKHEADNLLLFAYNTAALYEKRLENVREIKIHIEALKKGYQPFVTTEERMKQRVINWLRNAEFLYQKEFGTKKFSKTAFDLAVETFSHDELNRIKRGEFEYVV